MHNMVTENSDILDALDFVALAPEEQEELLLDINELVFKGSMVRLVEHMDDGTREEFDALISRDPDEEELQAFLAERVPGADEIVAETVEELRDDILAVTGANPD